MTKKNIVNDIIEAHQFLVNTEFKWDVNRALERNGQQAYESVKLLTRTLMNKPKAQLMNIRNDVMVVECRRLERCI